MDRRIKALLLVQVMALPLTTALTAAYGRSKPVVAVHCSLVFSQGCLLALWAAFGTTRRWLRSLCTVAGLACLSIAIPIAERGQAWLNDLKNLLLTGLVVVLPAILVFCVLWRLQRTRGLRLVRSPSQQATSESFQFSIKHLMVATVFVAVIISIRQGLHSFGYHGQAGVRLVDMAIIVATIVPCVLLVELATFWAALGLRRPFPRLMVVVPSGFAVGVIPPFYFLFGMSWENFALWSGVTGLQALFTAATLLVFRSCGWRLCREASSDQPMPVGDPISTTDSESSCVCDG